MIGEFLRQVNREQLAWSQYANQWRLQGASVIYASPSLHSSLQAVRADSGWEVIIDLDAWLASMMPSHTGVTRSAFSLTQCKKLFFSCERPLELGLQDFDYRTLTPIDMPDIQDKKWPHYGLETSRGTVWLSVVRDKIRHSSFSRPKIFLDYLPMPLHFELGSSKCRLSVINKLCCGDVLLIVEPVQRITLHGKQLGYYHRTGNEIMMEEGFLQNDLIDDMYNSQAENERDGERIGLSPRSLLPVKLTFTLQQATLTVQDLEALSQGHVFYCDEKAEKKIIISGNGLALAEGELIWIEDRLGVEVTRLYHEASNGE
ncbi:FliM/FliN family flagellar motor switch protein [Serratia marcescens]|uniref:FliM/FliN family flagellar motor switch protein n=1 Tax=Serratia marcescens TaxID=615 RepID=UPI00148E0867|nr:FliM/FliN family flagellar motor switch protein [Serratia marcescens]QJU42320.1 hypothetical protein HMI62_24750 [Serratia marcescens]